MNERFPTLREWDSLDWDGGRELGLLPPRIGFVEAEEMETERRERTSNEGPAKNLRPL